MALTTATAAVGSSAGGVAAFSGVRIADGSPASSVTGPVAATTGSAESGNDEYYTTEEDDYSSEEELEISSLTAAGAPDNAIPPVILLERSTPAKTLSPQFASAAAPTQVQQRRPPPRLSPHMAEDPCHGVAEPAQYSLGPFIAFCVRKCQHGSLVTAAHFRTVIGRKRFGALTSALGVDDVDTFFRGCSVIEQAA